MQRLLHFLWLLAAVAGGARADELLGFDSAGSEAQRGLESRYDANIDTVDMDTWLRRMSEKPHHAGSAAGKEVAEFAAVDLRMGRELFARNRRHQPLARPHDDRAHARRAAQQLRASGCWVRAVSCWSACLPFARAPRVETLCSTSRHP